MTTTRLFLVGSLLLYNAVVASSGAFTFLTMNVAGLPAFLNGNGESGDKTSNTAQIGQYLAKYNYDIVHVQEDFNYHATLYANDNHPYRTATSGGVPFGSGLNTLSNFDWTGFTRIKWNKCYINQGDCLTPKGFTYMRMQIAPGVQIDVYNLHTDAGDEANDGVARSDNIQQVSDYIKTHSAGNAVIVGGDTNSRYTRAMDNIRLLTQANGLADPWVQLERQNDPPAVGAAALLCNNPSSTNTCEVVDKIFYRGSDSLMLTAVSFDYVGDKFLSAQGKTLTDHDPVLINFTWSTK